MRKIGLTGGIGSGKSMVARCLEVSGYPVFYSDAVAKSLMENDPSMRLALVDLFGLEAFTDVGLNRPYLANCIFNDASSKERLEALVHPKVRETFNQWSENQKSALVFNEAAILFETGGEQHLDEVWLVVSPIELRLKRIATRDGQPEDRIRERMNNQWPDERKISLANHIIYNDEHQSILLQLEKLLK